MTGTDLVSKAVSQLGVVEKGGKDGKSGNIVPYWDWWRACTSENAQGSSWCACFVSWCFSEIQASSLVAAKNRYGFIYCPDGVTFFKKKNALIDPTKAKPGDVVFFDWEGAGISDHVGIVESVGAGFLTTIEGNTSAEGVVGGSNQNGGGVYRRKRYFGKTIIGVARPAWPVITATK